MKPAIFTLVFTVLIALVLPQAPPAPPPAEPVIVTTHTQDSTTPIFSADSTLNNGSIPIPIDDKYIPGTNYITEVGLKSDPTIKGIGSVFTVTESGGGPAAPELGLLG
ncbi:unnamed protein product [Rhizophagus irregularis]|nr:unnamed protein product [Rhizophagus irregularis]